MRTKIFVLLTACIIAGIGFCAYKIVQGIKAAPAEAPAEAREEAPESYDGETHDEYREPLGKATVQGFLDGNLFIACQDAHTTADLLTAEDFELLKYIETGRLPEKPSPLFESNLKSYKLMWYLVSIIEEKIDGKALELMAEFKINVMDNLNDISQAARAVMEQEITMEELRQYVNDEFCQP